MTHDAYETPAIVELGSLQDLTLEPKFAGRNDGFSYQGVDIGDLS